MQEEADMHAFSAVTTEKTKEEESEATKLWNYREVTSGQRPTSEVVTDSGTIGATKY
jgi:hypothetical protein